MTNIFILHLKGQYASCWDLAKDLHCPQYQTEFFDKGLKPEIYRPQNIPVQYFPKRTQELVQGTDNLRSKKHMATCRFVVKVRKTVFGNFLMLTMQAAKASINFEMADCVCLMTPLFFHFFPFRNAEPTVRWVKTPTLIVSKDDTVILLGFSDFLHTSRG